MSLFLHSTNADEFAVQMPFSPLCWNSEIDLSQCGLCSDHKKNIFFFPPPFPKLWAICSKKPIKVMSVCVCLDRGVNGRAAEVDWHSVLSCLSEEGAGCLKSRSWRRSRPLSSLSKYCLSVTDSKATEHWFSPFSHSATPSQKPNNLT